LPNKERIVKKYRTGIVGTAHLNSHLYSLTATPAIELVAAVAQTEDEKRPFQESGVSEFYSDYQEMLARADLDIIEIDTEANRRCEVTLAAAGRGVHVLGEKPIAVSLREADAMVEACDKAGVQFAIHNMRRCDPYHIRAKTLLDEGFIGELLTIRAICRDRRPAGHCLINLGTHLFDITRLFGGDVDWLFGHVTADGREVTADDIEDTPGGLGLIAGDKASVYLAFKNGATATVEYWASEPQYFGLELIGTNGCLALRQPEQPHPLVYRKDALWSADAEANVWQPIELPPETLAKLASNRWDDVYQLVVEEFVQCIETGCEHPTSGRQAREALELILGTYTSHRRKERVSIPLEQREHPLALWL
jgi:predicted dehydrogenase